MVHFDARSEWAYAELANALVVVAAACAHPGSALHGAPAALAYSSEAFETLVDAAVDDRWYHGRPGQGDPNVDRFTLVPLLEALELLRPHLTPALAGRVVQTVERVLEVQWREFGEEGHEPKRPLPQHGRLLLPADASRTPAHRRPALARRVLPLRGPAGRRPVRGRRLDLLRRHQ